MDDFFTGFFCGAVICLLTVVVIGTIYKLPKEHMQAVCAIEEQEPLLEYHFSKVCGEAR